MSAFNVYGDIVSPLYDKDGYRIANAFDVHGVRIYSAASWDDEVTIVKRRDEESGTNYYIVRIPQTRYNGEKQFPFVYSPNGASGGTMTTYQMVQASGFFMGINAGYFDAFQTGSRVPYGITIQNSQLILDNPSTNFNTNYTLTVDANGKLGYANPVASGTTAQQLLNAGFVSAVLGLVPLVIDYDPADVPSSIWSSTERAQRQIIGQFDNGDYCVLTSEGRGFDNSAGFTITEARTLCVRLGLFFAMALDGGGSTETVIGDTQINAVYEGTTGRIVPTFIVFNGTDTFSVPNA